MGLCLGFSLLSVVELIYFFTLRWCVLLCRRSRKKDQLHPDWHRDLKLRSLDFPSSLPQSAVINGRVLPTSEVFDHIFK